MYNGKTLETPKISDFSGDVYKYRNSSIFEQGREAKQIGVVGHPIQSLDIFYSS